MVKNDCRVVPVACLLHLFAFLDGVSIAYTAVYGIQMELKLVAERSPVLHS